ncbi:MAG: CheR family methyltransferase [Gemmatimonadaceae bacterium]
MSTAPAKVARTQRTEGWTDPAFARIAEAVYLVAGLVFPPNRQPSAESGMRRAMAALHVVDPHALARAVEQPGEARDTVLAELTVGETYFFRDGAQLDVLRTEIFPTLLATRGADAPLRLWSAGCASGEEPYTLAIMLRELGWPHPAQILGTDVARPRLDAARRARYTRWSLRGVADERSERWFARRGAHFQLDDSIRDAVRFAPLNLISDAYPSPETDTNDQDVVLCRNVLIYFDMKSVAAIATRLLAALAPDGWLILGASDPPLSGLVPCEVVMTAGGIAYRRADRDPLRAERVAYLDARAGEAAIRASRWYAAPVAADWIEPDVQSPLAQAVLVPPHAPVQVPASSSPSTDEEFAIAAEDFATQYGAANYARAEALARDAVARDADRHDAWIVLVRAIANQGRMRDADAQCVRALDVQRMSPELHYLHAMLLGTAGEYREAAKAARRAIYLDGDFVMAHLQLGDALARVGDTDRAIRAFEHVMRALARTDATTPVLAADGVSATRLRTIAESRLRGLHAARSA